MKTLLVVLSIFIAQGALADIPETLLGAYTGCGVSTAFGKRQVVLHLTALPTDLNGGIQYTGSFTWYEAPGGIYFPEVLTSGNRMLMRTEIKPIREHGLIINTLELTVNADQSISGSYKTNSMQGDGRVLSGVFTAKKLADGNIHPLNCQ